MGMYRGKRACRFMSMWQKESGNFDPKDSTIVMAEILKETPGGPPPRGSGRRTRAFVTSCNVYLGN